MKKGLPNTTFGIIYILVQISLFWGLLWDVLASVIFLIFSVGQSWWPPFLLSSLPLPPPLPPSPPSKSFLRPWKTGSFKRTCFLNDPHIRYITETKNWYSYGSRKFRHQATIFKTERQVFAGTCLQKESCYTSEQSND